MNIRHHQPAPGARGIAVPVTCAHPDCDAQTLARDAQQAAYLARGWRCPEHHHR